MKICYFDGSSIKEDKVIVSGLICSIDSYENVSEVHYCFKRVFDIPYGFSLHEDIALLNAVKEVIGFLGEEYIDEKIVFINDSMAIYKEYKNLKSKKVNFLNYFNKNAHLAKHRETMVGKDTNWINAINEVYKELSQINCEKIKIIHARRNNVGISIANIINKDANCFVKEESRLYVESSLKKICSRHYLYDLALKAPLLPK